MSKLPNFKQTPMEKRNVIIHALKCVTVPPAVSHPNNYWDRDGKRFVKLSEKAIKNNAELVFVNYSDGSDNVKIIDVQTIDPAIGITNDSQRITTKRGYAQWLANMNNNYNIL